ncbi:MAG: CD1871A family CXXC motif-containing protein [Bacillota bacterium]
MIFIAGAFFLLEGILRGEAAVVLRKAINICLECIGIG